MTEATALTLVLPWPDMRLMPNRKNGRHWGGVQSAKEQARRDGRVAATVELGRRRFIGGERIPVKVTFMSPDRRGRDLDNLLACIKPQIDGIAKALGVDDKRFRPLIVDDGLDPAKRGYLKIEVGDV
ncbi:endonuclease [Alcaligenes faecalis]|uniref:endonuclease n=1 Tax=Alcaligenes faecalis TaxID=511 RepID=UPI001292EEAA|nr:endonuclease [Alcaligenes faecalis]QFY77361.1 endonuclease [Alcaligenes faecalis]